MNTWKRITEARPQPNKEVLVWSGSHMFVATADFYSDEQRAQMLEWCRDLKMNGGQEWLAEHWTNCVGCFSEFGHKSYFDDDKVFWMELPERPGA